MLQVIYTNFDGGAKLVINTNPQQILIITLHCKSLKNGLCSIYLQYKLYERKAMKEKRLIVYH